MNRKDKVGIPQFLQISVYSDSVLCLANQRWKNQVEKFQQSKPYIELLGIDGEPTKFKWKMFPGLTSLEILQEIQKDVKDHNIEPEDFEDQIIFVSMFNDLGGGEEIQKNVFQVPNKSRITRRDSREDTGHSQARETKRNGTELSATHLMENEILSPHRWWNESKKPVTQYSWGQSVPVVVEF